MTEAIEIKLVDIALRQELRPRHGIDEDVVEDYRENVDDLPPILVAKENDGFRFILIDGWHRYRAHYRANRDSIMAIYDSALKPADFYFAAVRANKTHGIRFTAREKVSISKQLFIHENRSAAEISEAIGCSVRHATDLVKDLAHEKKRHAIHLARDASDRGFSERQIADYLQNLGYKTSKSAVNRWLQPDPVPTVTVKDIDAIQVSPQIGESPKRDTPTVDSADVNARMKTLMVDAAIKFRECSTPFYHEWLAEREVTSDECGTLNILIGEAIENYLDEGYLSG